MEVVNNEVLRRNGIIGHLKELRPHCFIVLFQRRLGICFFFSFLFGVQWVMPRKVMDHLAC